MIALWLVAVPQSLLAQPPTKYELQGLHKPVEILQDKWGISHIYAQTQDDLFFAQGFNAARDRLWQLDLWRRQGEGKLAEAFGPRFVAQDRAARLFLYRGDLQAEFASYHPDGERILSAFVAGINAYIDLTRANPNLLPLEFKLLGATPGYWSVTSPLIRIYGLTRNLSTEVKYARLVNLMGAEALQKVSDFQPPTTITVPPGLDLSLISTAVIADYNLARGSVTFLPSDLAKNVPAEKREYYARLLSQPPIDDRWDNPSQRSFESNNWTISGKLTATGRPILSGDPHRTQSVPSLRYMVHLNAPGWNVIGAGEPALPGVSLGHNDYIADALTIFSFADEEDLYVYNTNPENPSQYQYQGKWEDMTVLLESIPVKDASPQLVTLKFTRHGPVLYEDTTNHKAYALRAAYLEFPGTAVYLASLRVDQARNWQEFVAAMEKHYCPSENMVYADVNGNIGWFGGSIQPIRANWNGLLPVPGNGDYEWQGFLPTSSLPRVFNPPEGFFATANQYNVPPGYPFTFLSAHDWSDPFRFNRIQEVLSGGQKFTLADSMQLQYDDTSLPARQLVPLLNGLTSTDPDVSAALAQLASWDFVLAKDSVPATIYELWVNKLNANVVPLYVPPAAQSAFGSLKMTVLIRLVTSPDSAFGADPVAGRNAVLLTSLAQAVAQGKTLLGANMGTWTWGSLHHETLTHALSSAVSPSLQAILNVGPLPQSGDGYTVHATSYRLSDFNQTSGASYREVMDVGKWDNSFTLNNPGQSGDPNSPHYQDLFPLWDEGQFVPMLFSRGKIEQATETKFVLHPPTGKQ
ncbi:MAG: penicillin acylase family protein [Terriglobales bacterium]